MFRPDSNEVVKDVDGDKADKIVKNLSLSKKPKNENQTYVLNIEVKKELKFLTLALKKLLTN